jgi:hypothetical protein
MRDPDERVKRGMCVPMLGGSNSKYRQSLQ